MQKNFMTRGRYVLWTCLVCFSFASCGFNKDDTVSKEEYEALSEELDEANSRIDALNDKIDSLENDSSLDSESNYSLNIDDSTSAGTNDKDTVGDVSFEPVVSFTESKISIEDGFEILSDYTYVYDGLDAIEHIVVIKNNTEKTVELDSKSTIYSENGDLIGLCDSDSGCGIDVLGPGETAALHEYSTSPISEGVGYYETSIKVNPTKKTPIYENLEYEIKTTDSNVIITVHNDNDISIKSLKANLIFFKNGEVVDYDRVSFTDYPEEFESGTTEYGDSSTYKDYDTINIYFYGS